MNPLILGKSMVSNSLINIMTNFLSTSVIQFLKIQDFFPKKTGITY